MKIRSFFTALLIVVLFIFSSCEKSPKMTFVLYSDNTGAVLNEDEERICGFELWGNRKDPIHLRMATSIDLFGINTDDVYLASGYAYIEYGDALKEEIQNGFAYNKIEKDAEIQYQLFSQSANNNSEEVAQRIALEKKESAARAEAERLEAENKKKQIVGTYEFQVHIPNMDNVVTGYSYGEGFTKERRQVGTIDGVEYMVVHSDMRVSILEPGDRKKYIGEVNEVLDGVFTVSCTNREGKFGLGYTLYKSGEKIGSAGDSYGGYGTFVVDTKSRRVYKTVSDYKGSDIGDTEHLIYDSFVPSVRTSNNTEWERNYYDRYKDKYQD